MTERPERECRRCDAPTTQRSGYCSACRSDVNRKSRARHVLGRYIPREYHIEASNGSKPPAPPPGFNPRDLYIGRPLS